MKSTHRLFLTLSAWGVVALAHTGAAPSWPHEGSNLTPDPDVVWGELPNGMRYVLRPNANPPGRVSMRLLIDAGSLLEKDDERGLVHFVEHMAYHGAGSFPVEKLKEVAPRLDTRLAPDAGARTSYEETVYSLELKENTPEFVSDCLLMLSEFADGIDFDPKEIGKERLALVGEMFSKNVPRERTLAAELGFSFPNAIVGRRIPIGTEEVILGTSPEKLIEFYRKVYRPDRMVLVVVGDIDPVPVLQLIVKHFSVLKNREEPPVTPDLGSPYRGAGLRVGFHLEPQVPEATIAITIHRPHVAVVDTKGLRYEALLRALANRIVSRRFVSQSGESSGIVTARVSRSALFGFVDQNQVRIVCRAEDWEKALVKAEQELRRAQKFGFTQTELEEAKSSVLRFYGNLAGNASKRTSPVIASAIVTKILGNKVFTDPRDDLARIRKSLNLVTSEQCRDIFRRDWQAGEVSLFVAGNIDAGTDPAGKILDLFRSSSFVEVSPPVAEAAAPSFAYKAFGPAGIVASRDTIGDLGVTQVKFGNNVSLNVKPTDFRPGEVEVRVRFGGGRLEIPPDKPGIAQFAQSVFESGALEAHSLEELQAILVGRNVQSAFRVEDDAFVLEGRSDSKDLPMQLQLLCAYLTAPGFRPEGIEAVRKTMDLIDQQLRETSEGVLESKVEAFLHGNNYRFRVPALQVVASRTMDELRVWLEKSLRESYVEVSIVGDVALDEAVESAAATFGAIPIRAATKDPYKSAGRIAFPRSKRRQTFHADSTVAVPILAYYWPTVDAKNDSKVSSLNVLGAILTDRLKKKFGESLGKNNHPQVENLNSEAFPNYGYLSVLTRLPSAGKAAYATKSINEVVGGLIRTGVTARERDDAVALMLEGFERQQKQNRYWLDAVLDRSQEKPKRLDRARAASEDLNAVTVAELNALAKRFLPSHKASVVQILPKS